MGGGGEGGRREENGKPAKRGRYILTDYSITLFVYFKAYYKIYINITTEKKIPNVWSVRE